MSNRCHFSTNDDDSENRFDKAFIQANDVKEIGTNVFISHQVSHQQFHSRIFSKTDFFLNMQHACITFLSMFENCKKGSN